MTALIYNEIYKLFSSFRTYATFTIAIILMVMINLGLYTEGETILSYILEPLKDYFILDGNILNGYLIAYFSLNTLWVHIPILILVVSTYIFSSEFEYGTIKILLSQPISRSHLFLAKLFTLVVYNIVFMFVLAFSALIPAVLIFGKGDVMVLNEGLQFVPEVSFLKRFGLAILFASLAMTAFSALGMLFAIWFRNTLTAILLSFGILIFHTLIQSFVIGLNSYAQGFLFTYHMSMWQQFFVSEIPFNTILQSIGFLTIMFATLSLVTLYRFNSIDIKE